MKVRSYLLLMALATLIPVIIFSTVAIGQLLEAERSAALRGMRETVNAITLAIDAELSSAEAALAVLAQSEAIKSGDSDLAYQQAEAVGKGHDEWTILTALNGQQLVNTFFPRGATLPVLSPRSMTRIEKVAREGVPQVSDLVIGTASMEHAIAVDYPVKVDGRVRYILTKAFRADHFAGALLERNLPKSWVIGIFDRSGISIVRSPSPERFVGRPVRAELYAASRANAIGVLRHETRDGVDVFDSYTHSRKAGWTIAVGVPVAEIELAARRAVWLSVLGLVAAVLCAATVAVFFARRLVGSIAGAVDAADTLAKGEAPPPLKTSVGEVDQLHLALNNAGTLIQRGQRERAELLLREQQARRLAEEQNKAKDEFLAMLGHELRNPLSAITSAIDVIEAPGMKQATVERARSILRQQTEHLGMILDDLLDLSRIMSGKISLNIAPIDLGRTVQMCIDILQTTGRMTAHRLVLDLHPVRIAADATRIEQIVNNLLINAVKYTPEDGLIDVSVRHEDGSAVLTVKDTGIGISADLLPHIFDVFVQGSTAIDRAQGGLGIGLSLVHQLVTMHGGSVTASSKGAGQGSSFTVRLPVSIAASTSGPSSPNALAGGISRRILLVEDNEQARLMVASMLGAHGHNVYESGNGLDGLKIAVEERPDIAIVDIGLPGMDGYQFARRVRDTRGIAGMPLIALTGYGQEADRHRALQAGFNVHMVKPVNIPKLLDEIDRLVVHGDSEAVRSL
ncbi:ATP-binding protein [Herbaspirillum sp. GCM10030257]|uniref:hybrid sensor histidine kinase/response regulator n=1 Tax=Herbaspirillum sp. GCM10030257 TaxID=3273393 RepID=UPI0036065F1F